MQESTVFQLTPLKGMLRGLKTLAPVTSSTQAVVESPQDRVAKMYHKLPCDALTTPDSMAYPPMPLKEMLHGLKTLVLEISSTQVAAVFLPDQVAKTYHKLPCDALTTPDSMAYLPMPLKEMLHGLKTLVQEKLSIQEDVLFQKIIVVKIFLKHP